MASNSAANNNLSLKLLIDTKKNKVLFAKPLRMSSISSLHCFSCHLLPSSSFLTKEAVVGCLGNLYSSVENLNNVYMQPNLSKDLLLNPTIIILPASPSISSLLSSAAINNHSQITPKLYRCSYGCGGGRNTVTDVYNSRCGHCSYPMTTEVRHIKGEATATATAAMAPATSGQINNYKNGIVKEVITYMIMDDLVIQPILSTISSITMLNQFNVKDVGVLKEEVFQLGINEGLKLLKASMEFKTTVLTSVFLAS